MYASLTQRGRWFDLGQAHEEFTHLLIVSNHKIEEDFPVYVHQEEDAKIIVARYWQLEEEQNVSSVYNLKKERSQISLMVFNYE